MPEPNKTSGSLSGKRFGNYVIHRRLGKGGMGEVYLAHDVPLDRPVALKVMSASWAHEPEVVERFHREARAAAKLNHPNIVQIYAVGTEDDVPYFAMEFVEGAPLDALLKAHGPMPWQRVMNIVGQVSSALDAAHAKGIIHRDIKPANILIDKQGRARVTDFGVAKVLSARTQLTTDGTFIGTPQYMSPEQCGMGEVTAASDLFSLGATAYEMLTGSVPFRGDTPASLIKKITQDMPKSLDELVTGVPEPISQLVCTLLEKEPSRRYKTAQEVLLELNRIKTGAPRETVNLGATVPMKTGATVKRKLPIGLIAVAAALVIVIGGLLAAASHGFRKKGAEAADGTGSESNDIAPIEEMVRKGPKLQKADARSLVTEHDTNKNGQLEESEIPVAVRDFVMPLADTNGDHVVTADELADALQRIDDRFEVVRKSVANGGNRNKPGLRPDEILLRFDRNWDGAVSQDELPPNMKGILQLNDLNHDGKVTMLEIESSRRNAAAQRKMLDKR